MSVAHITTQEFATLARIIHTLDDTQPLYEIAQRLEQASKANVDAFMVQYGDVQEPSLAEAIAAAASDADLDLVANHFGPVAYNCVDNGGRCYADPESFEWLQAEEKKAYDWQSAKRRTREREEQDAEAFAEVGKQPVLTDAEIKAACIAAGCQRVITAEFRVNESDSYSDYHGGRTVRRIVIGYGKGKRENFKQLRKAAAQFPPTADYGPGLSQWRVWVNREDPQGDFGYCASTAEGDWFTTREAAEEWIQSEIATAETDEYTQVGVCAKQHGYSISEESIENRENYSMGGGNYLGTHRYGGWQVKSTDIEWSVGNLEVWTPPKTRKTRPAAPDQPVRGNLTTTRQRVPNTLEKPMKTQFRYRWDDMTQASGPMDRSRVAYLLRAARSRRDEIVRFPTFYRIGNLYILRQNRGVISWDKTDQSERIAVTELVNPSVCAK